MKNYIYLILYCIVLSISLLFIPKVYEAKHALGLLSMVFFAVYSIFQIYMSIDRIINNFKTIKK
jgi:hypothetical protein